MCENISEWMQEWLCFPQRGQWWIAYQTFYICRFFYSKNPLLVAQVATPCSHSFCEWCVNKIKSKYARRVIKCESCREPVSGWCKNLLANNFLSMVDGECKWCSKKVKLNNAKDHIEYCEEMEGPCKQCKAIVRQRGRCPQRILLNGGCVMPMWFDIQKGRRRKSHPDDVWLNRSAVPT